ncbi:MAG: hypothetical protein DWP94_04705 [Flavobacterium sp.]|nr:MAG: hypothetical protein DWP94_04705 [Flavobacterium sp.]
MLTSFFSKSNPVNFLLLGATLGIGYIISLILQKQLDFDLLFILEILAVTGLLVFTILLLNFIVRKNNLTRKNTFAALIFTAYTLMIPSIFAHTKIIIAVVCCLFALRRILSLASEKNVEKKILDASLWLALASFFYFYCLLFFIVVYFAIVRRPQTSYRYLLIPPLAILAVLSITTSYFYLTENSFAWFERHITSISLDFGAYNSFALLIPASLFLSSVLWICFYRIGKVGSMMRKERPNFLVIPVILISAFAVSLGSPLKDGSELYFLIPPLAIATADYIENREELYIKEIYIWLVILLPVVLLFI